MFKKNKIGVVEITGAIMSSRKAVEDLHAFASDKSIRAIVVRIDSPGGAVAPSQEIYEALKFVKTIKPLAVSMGTVAASGGYYIAIGSDHIFANPGTITGSIGIISQMFNVKDIADHVGLKVETFTTGQYKDTGNQFREMTEVERDYFKQLQEDFYQQFTEAISTEREIPLEDLISLADGRVFTGRQAKEEGLIDHLGTLMDAVDHVSDACNIKDDVSLIYPKEPSSSLLIRLLTAFKSVFQGHLQEASYPKYLMP